MFGARDEDWEMYRGIDPQEINGREERTQAKLNELEAELRTIDPTFLEDYQLLFDYSRTFNVGEMFEINVDLVRAPEAIFQPFIAGVDQMGVSELITFVVKQFPLDVQESLLANIQLLGGGSQVSNLVPRLLRSLQPEFETGTRINISLPEDPINGAWLGLQSLLSQDAKYVEENSYLRREYEEKGGERLCQTPKEHIFFI
jgi:actin-related protein 5